jgi:1-acyl-sn-glycerol-3-phosphate acyltransferase
MNPFRKAWLVFAYYFSWFLFGAGGLALNVVCLPFLVMPHRERYGPLARRATRWMFDFWLRWMHASGVVDVIFHGFDRPLPPGTVYLANHPTLVEAPFLLARLPDTVCVFKPALLKNPCIAPAALLCGYVSGDAGVDGLRLAAARVATGCSLLIFPEGTRTEPGTELNPLRSGFALIARRANAPIQIIQVRSSPLMARKGHPWWQPPPLPGRFEFTLGELIPAGHELTASALNLTAHVAQQLRA